MALCMACEEISVPLSVAPFWDGWDNPDPVVEVVAFEGTGEWFKAMIAGYEGHTGAEHVAWRLCKAEKVLPHRPEQPQVVIVVHDGQPVAELRRDRRPVGDWGLSMPTFAGWSAWECL